MAHEFERLIRKNGFELKSKDEELDSKKPSSKVKRNGENTTERRSKE